MSVRVGIIGAGPAGLVLAATLAKRSTAFSVKVFEQGADHRAAASYDPNRSYTIDITGHGALAVKALGAVQIFDEKLIKFTGLRILCTGEDNWFDGKGWTGSRGDICKTLLGVLEGLASPTVEVHFDTTAEILDMMKGTVQTTSKTGERVVHDFDVVVGADGAGGKLRGAISKLPSFAMESINMENYSIKTLPNLIRGCCTFLALTRSWLRVQSMVKGANLILCGFARLASKVLRRESACKKLLWKI